MSFKCLLLLAFRRLPIIDPGRMSSVVLQQAGGRLLLCDPPTCFGRCWMHLGRRSVTTRLVKIQGEEGPHHFLRGSCGGLVPDAACILERSHLCTCRSANLWQQTSCVSKLDSTAWSWALPYLSSLSSSVLAHFLDRQCRSACSCCAAVLTRSSSHQVWRTKEPEKT